MAEAGWADPAAQLGRPAGRLRRGEPRPDAAASRCPWSAAAGSASAVEVQRRLADLAGEFVASGECGDAVPDAAEIVALWQETLDRLARRDLDALTGRCDWVLKYLLLDRFRGRRGLTLGLARHEGARSAVLQPRPAGGAVLADGGGGAGGRHAVRRRRSSASSPSRRTTRGPTCGRTPLRRFGEHVATLNWDRIRFRLQSARYWWSETVLAMPDPSRLGREESEPLLAKSATLTELIEAVGTERGAGIVLQQLADAAIRGARQLELGQRLVRTGAGRPR